MEPPQRTTAPLPRERAPCLPRVSSPLLSLFTRYTRWYLPRHLHSLRLSREGWQPQPHPTALRIVYLNHASWWDPLVCLHLRDRFFPSRPSYALIEDAALARYPFFARLGFIGIEPSTRRGAATFLRTLQSLASQPGAMLWVTPQARFCDVRERPLGFERGLAHVASRLAIDSGSPMRTVEFIPLAIEYTHWHERTPEALVRFGKPFAPGPLQPSCHQVDLWNDELEHRLATEMDALAMLARRRDPGRFHDLLRGRAGVGGPYDLWRRLHASLRRRSFTPRHGTL